MMTLGRFACLLPAAAMALQAVKQATVEQQQCKQYRRVEPPFTYDMKDKKCLKVLPPKLLFIGQAHSGSTALSDLMELHPELHSGDMKEHHYFNKDIGNENKRAAKNINEYHEQFCVTCNTTISFDATMEYINLGFIGEKRLELVKQRLGEDLKIILMMRDPVDLLFSNYCQSTKKDGRPFTSDSPANLSATKQMVTEPLRVWQKVFDNEANWLFLKSDDFFEDPQKVLDKVFTFLGVKPMKVPLDVTDNKGDLLTSSGRRRCTLKATSEERHAYWKVKDNVNNRKELEKLTGLQFTWKSK